jgi:iron complex outermembrane receptor protein
VLEQGEPEDTIMVHRSGATGRHAFHYAGTLAFAVLGMIAAPLSPALSQEAGQTGSVAGRVVDEQGAGIAGAQVAVRGTRLGTQTRSDGGYLIPRVPAGTHVLQARMLGFSPDSTSVTVSAGAEATQDFTLSRDPLQLQEMVVTGTTTPRQNLAASVAVTTLTAQDVQQAAPRSTTEMLRYVPGFTRVESSGGEVNQNISMRGILGVEYVMFMEDGMPVFPTMHTFFMNADNLFRFDQNIERMEVVRGGASALFGSNTPGAIVNFINKTGGDQFGGVMGASGGTYGLARYDLNAGGPMGEDWNFNVGGFYRYDHGVRDPGFPGIRGGQLKANVTRQLDNGYLRASVKYIDDRNQFILPLPFDFSNPEDPEYVPGFSDYGSMNTNEGLDLQVPIPTGTLKLPLDNGLKTKATWFTVDAAFDLADGWRFQNTAQVMQNDQEWNAITNSNFVRAADFVTLPTDQGGLGLPAGTTGQFLFTNHFDPTGAKLPFDTPNGLVATMGDFHVEKPISAIHDQIQLRKTFGPHSLAIGAYFANYTQDNRWFFTDILTDVRDNPRFLDLVITPAGGGTPFNFTQNGFRNFLSNYVNGTGQTTVVSGVVGGEIQLTERLRADLGARVEYDDFVQNSENTEAVDLDGDPATTFNNITFGNNSFRHFTNSVTDWAGSLGLNYQVRDNLSVYASGSRGYKMPALDEYLNATAQEQVDLFESREVQSIEGGVKAQVGRLGFTVNGFWTKLKNIVSQGAVTDPVTGGTIWEINFEPETKSYGAEVEAVATPVVGLQLLGNGTILWAEFASGTDLGARLNGVPRTIGNLAAIYSNSGFQLKGDMHWVANRPTGAEADAPPLPAYNYFNFGAAYTLPDQGIRFSVDLLNAFQSKGIEEGNPRFTAAGGSPLVFARPILPRRITAGIEYVFGGGRRVEQSP